MSIRFPSMPGTWWICFLGLSITIAYAGVEWTRTSPLLEPRTADVIAGREVYTRTCAPCHGFDGEGFPGIGKPLQSNGSVRQQSEGQLAKFLAVGRMADDPLNTTGMEMPPRGGDVDLSDQDLRNVAAYLHTLSP